MIRRRSDGKSRNGDGAELRAAILRSLLPFVVLNEERSISVRSHDGDDHDDDGRIRS